MSGCAVAGAGQRISSASRTAAAMSFVTSDELRLVPPAKILHGDRCRRPRCAPRRPRASRRHSRTSWPASAKSPAAANEPLPPPSTAMRIRRDPVSRSTEMLHLAHRVARQASTNTYSRGTLKRASCVSRCASSARASHRRAGAPHHIGDRHLLPFRIGAADHGGFGDAGMRDQHALDLGRIDVLAARDDHVLLAVVDEEMPVGVARADVAGMIPAVAQRLGGRRRVAPVLEEHVRPAHHDLAGDAGRDLAAGVVDDARLAHEAGQAGRAGALVAADARVDRDRAGLGRAVDLQHRHAARREGIDQALRHLRRAGGERAQAGRCRSRPSADARSRPAWWRAPARSASAGRARSRPASRRARSARAASRSRRAAAPAWSGC